jgi:hypothetical protein
VLPTSFLLFLNRDGRTEIKGHDGLRRNFGGLAAHRRARASPDQSTHGGALSAARDGANCRSRTRANSNLRRILTALRR